MHTLRFLEAEDWPAALDYLTRNRTFHREWMPIRPEHYFTAAYQQEFLRKAVEARQAEEEYRFGIFHESQPDLLLGVINCTAIERGVFQNLRLGYSIDRDYCRQGIATANLRRVVQFAFDGLLLHRVEANVMPRNTASRRLLKRCGFTEIGLSRRYLCINGAWEDHVMYALLAEDFKATDD